LEREDEKDSLGEVIALVSNAVSRGLTGRRGALS
jgi:hypothetical protein